MDDGEGADRSSGERRALAPDSGSTNGGASTRGASTRGRGDPPRRSRAKRNSSLAAGFEETTATTVTMATEAAASAATRDAGRRVGDVPRGRGRPGSRGRTGEPVHGIGSNAKSVGGDRTGDGRDVVVRRIRFVRSVGRVVFGGIGEEGPTGERRLRVAHVRGDESERLATKEGVIDELEDHEHVDAHEIHSGVHLRLELIAGHEAPEEVEGVAHQPLGEEPRGEALGGLEAEVLDELGDLRDQPARDGGEPEVETHRVRGRVHAVREVQTYLRAGGGGTGGSPRRRPAWG